ncbi:MAG: RNA polymerase sporulation sigma factor SigE [Agathobacter sp.]|nr:RNA polymerase sporulation sigma factor SigE [Agathobacter sp.]
MLHINWSKVVDYFYFCKRYVWYIGKRILTFLKGEKYQKTVFYIGGSDVLPPPLSAEEEKECLMLLNTEDNKTARNRLISHNLRLVVYLARKFENTGVGVEDLVSIGTIGLIKGIHTFNPDKNIKLATYASRCIENEILMHLRRTNKLKLEVSFDEPLNVDWDGNELLLSDILGTEEDVIYRDLETEAEIGMLRKAMEKLSEREREIIELRYGYNRKNEKEMTQKEVADLLGISQSYISRLEKKIMLRLRREIQRIQ